MRESTPRFYFEMYILIIILLLIILYSYDIHVEGLLPAKLGLFTELCSQF